MPKKDGSYCAVAVAAQPSTGGTDEERHSDSSASDLDKRGYKWRDGDWICRAVLRVNGVSKPCNNRNKAFRVECNWCSQPRPLKNDYDGASCYDDEVIALQLEVRRLKAELDKASALAESAAAEAEERVKEILDSSHSEVRNEAHKVDEHMRKLLMDIQAALAGLPMILGAMEPAAAMSVLPVLVRGIVERLKAEPFERQL